MNTGKNPNKSRILKTRLPPNLSVKTPIGTRAIEPSNTGVASNNPTAVEDSLNSTFKYTAKGEKRVHAAKHTANATVASISTLVFPFGVCTDSFIKTNLLENFDCRYMAIRRSFRLLVKVTHS